MSISIHNEHRPWPIPRRSWIMKQTWNDLLFAHWPVHVEQLRKYIPLPLTIDTYDDYAYLGIVAFTMNQIQPRGLPVVAYVSTLSEINLRTYVSLDGKAGVYFFSLDASQWLAVEVARKFFHLPYFHTDVQVSLHNKNALEYHSIRRDRRGPSGEFHATYQPVSEVYNALPHTLEHWLTERYCLYTNTHKHIYRGEIAHSPWPLQQARADLHLNTLADGFGIELPWISPILHFAKSLDVLIWSLEQVRSIELD